MVSTRTLGTIGTLTALLASNDLEAQRRRAKAPCPPQSGVQGIRLGARFGNQCYYAPSNEVNGNSATVYFETNGKTFNTNDRKTIAQFLREHPRANGIIIESYADSRGTNDANLTLAGKRIESTVEVLQQLGYRGTVDRTVLGEAKAYADTTNASKMALDRRVRLYVGGQEQVITEGLRRFPAQVYLFDGSGSMTEPVNQSGTSKWQVIASAQLPKTNGAAPQTLIFNDQYCADPVQNLRTMRPAGGTPLWRCLRTAINRTPVNGAITVFSDGQDTEGGATPDEIIAAAKARRVKVYMTGVGINDVTTQCSFMKIANATTGGVHFNYSTAVQPTDCKAYQ